MTMWAKNQSWTSRKTASAKASACTIQRLTVRMREYSERSGAQSCKDRSGVGSHPAPHEKALRRLFDQHALAFHAAARAAFARPAMEGRVALAVSELVGERAGTQLHR